MALTITSDAAWGGNSNTGTISCNYQAPAGGYLTGDYAVLFVAIHKASQAGTEVPATPSGWTLLGNLEGGVNTTAAADVGLCRIYAYGRNPAGGESGSLSITINNNTSGVSGTNAVARQIHIRSDTASTYDVAFASGNDATGGTSWSVTFSSDPGIKSGDVLLTAAALPTDTLPTGIPGTVAATGATIGANANHGTGSSALGLDGTGQAFTNAVTAGSATAAPTWTATLSGTTTNWAGPAAMVRVRENADQAISLSDTAAGDDQLTLERVDGVQALPAEFWQLNRPDVPPHAPVLQLLGDRASETLVALSDTGTAVDAATVAADVPAADTAAGVDALTVTAAVPLADTASGVDSLSITVAVSLADTGAGVDALSVSVAGDTDAYQAEPGVAWMFTSPRTSATQVFGSAEASGDQLIGLADTAAGSDSLTAAAAVPLADTAAGADALSAAAAVPLADTAAGADSLAVAAALALADTGAGVDALTTAVAVALADTGSGADALTAAAAAPLADTAAGVDSLTVAVSVALDDTGTATDALSISIAGEPDPYQAGPRSTWLFLRPNDASLQLIGDATTPGDVALSLPDQGTATDALTATAAVPLSDTGSAVDALSVTVTVSLADSGSATDAATVAAAVPRAETATAADVLSVTATLTLADTATATDAMTIARSVALSDAATATDALSIAVTVNLADTAVALDVLSLPATATAITRVSTGSRRQRVSTRTGLRRVSTGNSRQRITTELG